MTKPYKFTHPTNGRTYYKASVELGIVNGKRRRKTFFGKSREIVSRRMAAWRREHGNDAPVVDERITLGQWCAAWLDGREGLRPSSVERYGQALRRVPADITAIRLARLAPEDLERTYRQLRQAGMAPAGVLKVHRVLHTALERAFRRGYVVRNVASLVDAPRVPHTEVQTITAAQALALLAAAKGDRYEALYYLAVTTGMRQGELLALRWADIDWSASAVMVRGSLRKGVRSETKTGRERRIALAPSVVAVLREHEHRQKVERLAAGRRWRDTGTVFASSVGTPTSRQVFETWSWHKVRERAGLPMPFKDVTRHGAATILLAAGVHSRIVGDILGHSQVATTDRYSHVLPGMQEQAVQAMERLISGGRSG